MLVELPLFNSRAAAPDSRHLDKPSPRVLPQSGAADATAPFCSGENRANHHLMRHKPLVIDGYMRIQGRKSDQE